MGSKPLGASESSFPVKWMLLVDAEADNLLAPLAKGSVAGAAGKSDILIENLFIPPIPYNPASIAALKRAEVAEGGGRVGGRAEGKEGTAGGSDSGCW